MFKYKKVDGIFVITVKLRQKNKYLHSKIYKAAAAVGTVIDHIKSCSSSTHG